MLSTVQGQCTHGINGLFTIRCRRHRSYDLLPFIDKLLYWFRWVMNGHDDQIIVLTPIFRKHESGTRVCFSHFCFAVRVGLTINITVSVNVSVNNFWWRTSMEFCMWRRSICVEPIVSFHFTACIGPISSFCAECFRQICCPLESFLDYVQFGNG